MHYCNAEEVFCFEKARYTFRVGKKLTILISKIFFCSLSVCKSIVKPKKNFTLISPCFYSILKKILSPTKKKMVWESNFCFNIWLHYYFFWVLLSFPQTKFSFPSNSRKAILRFWILFKKKEQNMVAQTRDPQIRNFGVGKEYTVKSTVIRVWKCFFFGSNSSTHFFVSRS